MPVMPYRSASCLPRLKSRLPTSNLATLTLPLYLSANRLTVGANALQGGHQFAVTSTSTGTLLSTTSFCQFAWVNSTTFSLVACPGGGLAESHTINATNATP